VRVLTSDPALQTIRDSGGKLYVWVKRGRCCAAGNSTLATSPALPKHTTFTRVDSCGEFELYLPSAIGRYPDKLEIELRRFPRRVEAYWDGCIWVV
jgi:hypothetical protein